MERSAQAAVILCVGILMVAGGAAGLAALVVLVITLSARDPSMVADLGAPRLVDALVTDGDVFECQFPRGPGTLTIAARARVEDETFSRSETPGAERSVSGGEAREASRARARVEGPLAGWVEVDGQVRAFSGYDDHFRFHAALGKGQTGRLVWHADWLEVHSPADHPRFARCVARGPAVGLPVAMDVPTD